MNPHSAGVAQAALPLIFARIGLVKLGYFHWGIAALGIVLAAFAYRSGYMRAKYRFTSPASELFPQVPKRPLP
jgi:hypothetical protein